MKITAVFFLTLAAATALAASFGNLGGAVSFSGGWTKATGYTGYADDEGRAGPAFGLAAGYAFGPWSFRARAAMEPSGGGDYPHPSAPTDFNTFVEADSASGSEFIAGVAAGYDLPGGAFTLVPGVALDWNHDKTTDRLGRYVRTNTSETHTLRDVKVSVNDWYFTPTFGVKQRFGLLGWNAGAGLGYHRHLEDGTLREVTTDYTNDTQTDNASDIAVTADSLVARLDAGAALYFGRFFRLGADVEVKTDLATLGHSGASRDDWKRTDITVAVAPAFTF